MRKYVERIVKWAGDDMLMMHGVVISLREESEKDVMVGAAHVLVAESAVHILKSNTRMKKLAKELLSMLEPGDTGPAADVSVPR